MKIPEYIEVKTAYGQRAAFLSPRADGLKDAYVDNVLNAESTLQFYLPSTSKKIAELTPECQIWAGGKVYSLLQPEAVDNVRDEKNTVWSKFMAVERWKTDLETSFIEPYISNDPNTPTPSDLTVIIVGSGTNLSGGLYQVGTAAHAMYAVLQGSGWTLGVCDVTGIHDLQMEKESRLALIKEIQNIWGGYLVWDSVNKTVSLRNADIWQNYTGFQVRYRKNLKHITRTQSNKLVTKMYAFGKDDLDISSVNGGFKYLTNNSYTPRAYTGIYRNQDITDAQELKDKAVAELALNCHPRYKYSIKMVDLRTLPEYSHEDFSVGDMADVIDADVAPESPRVRITRHKYNLFKPWDCEVELGDPTERLIENLKASFETTSFISNTFSANGQLSGYKLMDFSVTYKHLADAAVTTRAIANLSVDVNKLADLAVEASKLANSSVTATKIANAAVGSAAIAQAAVGSAHIANAAILTAHIADAAITNAKIGNLSADKITSGLLRGIRIQQYSDSGQIFLDLYKDTYGGIFKIYDRFTGLDVSIGAEDGYSSNIGGKIVLYNRGETAPRVALGIVASRSAGIINLMGSNDNIRAGLYADSSYGAELMLADENENVLTRITTTEGYINNNQIAVLRYGNFSTQRPTNRPIGTMYLNTASTPPTPIWWSGTAWYDALGNVWAWD